MKKDYYKILEIDRKASVDDIKKAYRKLAKKWHPDKNNGFSLEEKKQAEKKFKDINDANIILTDPKKREIFDCGGDPEDINGNYYLFIIYINVLYNICSLETGFAGFGQSNFGGFNFGGNEGNDGQFEEMKVNPNDLFEMLFRNVGGFGGGSFSRDSFKTSGTKLNGEKSPFNVFFRR